MEGAQARLTPSTLAGRAGNACARVTASPRFGWALLAVVLVWEFSVLPFKASRKLLDYDELLTLHISNLQPFSLVWKALQAGADGMPPGYYLLVRLATIFPGDPRVTLRFPSILGYILSLIGVYWFARKRLPAPISLAAMLLITVSPFREYALMARPYSLMVGFLAISAVLWQRIGEKRFMTPLLAVFLALAVSCHHLAIVAVSSFGIAELTWSMLSRRIRWGVWTACLLATWPFFLSLPLLLRYRDIFGKSFWSQPTWRTVLSTYGTYLGIDPPILALVLVVFFGIVVGGSLLRMRRTSGEGSLERDFSPPEIVLVGGFLCFPALLVALTKLVHSGYTPRYGWPAILGLAFGLAYVLGAIRPKSYSIHLLGALLIAFAVQGGIDFGLLAKAGEARPDERWAKLAKLSNDEPGVPVVIASGVTFLLAAEYAPLELRGRLVQVVDADAAVRFLSSDTVDRTNRILAQFIPLRVEDLAPFEADHQRFILHTGGDFDWLTQYLLESRYRLRLLSKDAGDSLYFVER